MARFRKDMPPDLRTRESRRGPRTNARVPISVEWQDDGGSRQNGSGYTCVLNGYGCLLVLPHNLPLEHRLRVTNMTNQRSLVGVVVWKGKERVEGWELALELVDPDMDFWGLEL
ncbi:MAG: PilZ domain-containing protein [Candidatus Acidiferrales bacterium]